MRSLGPWRRRLRATLTCGSILGARTFARRRCGRQRSVTCPSDLLNKAPYVEALGKCLSKHSFLPSGPFLRGRPNGSIKNIIPSPPRPHFRGCQRPLALAATSPILALPRSEGNRLAHGALTIRASVFVRKPAKERHDISPLRMDDCRNGCWRVRKLAALQSYQ